MLGDKCFAPSLRFVYLPIKAVVLSFCFTSELLIYIFVHARKNGIDTEKRAQKSR